MDFHRYVNKEITFVKSNDIMMYARGKTYTTEKLVEGCTQESGLGSTINVTTLGDVSQPSYLTEIQIRLVSGYLRLRIPEKKRCNAN